MMLLANVTHELCASYSVFGQMIAYVAEKKRHALELVQNQFKLKIDFVTLVARETSLLLTRIPP